MLSAVETDDDGNINSVLVTNKHGLSALRAKVYIDTTGDADLCAWAGAAFHKGDEHGKGLMPATHCFVLANVNTKLYAERNGSSTLHGANKNSPIHRIVADGKYPLIPDVHFCSNIVGPGCVGFNAGHVFDIDNTDPASVSQGLMLGRKIAQSYRDALAEYVPEIFGDAWLVQTGSLLGVRETRRIVGDYELTLHDYLARRSFHDDICRNAYFIDVHNKVKEAMQNVQDIHKFESTTHRYGPGESHGVPYRCLIPRDLKNVLVAGRSVSAEQMVQGSIRIMACCLCMGEAAGLAAALVKSTGDVRSVNIADLQNRLRAYGAYLPETPALQPTGV
jgi:hypothetical protein